MENQRKKLRLDELSVASFVTDSSRERALKVGGGSIDRWVCADLPGDWPDPADFCSNGMGSILGSPCNYTDPGNRRDTVMSPVNVYPPAVPGTNAVPCYPLPGGGGNGGGTSGDGQPKVPYPVGPGSWVGNALCS